MYFYYALMGVLGLMIMVGLRYRYSLGLFTIMWWGTYLMQKTSYNNHYYLLILLCILMMLVPAHKNASFDAQNNNTTRADSCPRWCYEIFKWQLLIVYIYAALAKLYPGWIEGDFISLAFKNKDHFPIIGDALQLPWLQKIVVIGGFLFDLTIIPIMYWAKTKKFGLYLSIAFHLFNSIVFGIGIFPYLMIASTLLFFNTSGWQAKIPGYHSTRYGKPQTPIILWPVLILYFIIQLWLPVRHYFIPGDVFKTEEGHRMAWRMMLRSKSGYAEFTVVDKYTGKNWKVLPSSFLTSKQSYKLGGRPDMIWQFSQYLARHYAEQGFDNLEIYANARGYLNNSMIDPLVDPEVDLLSQSWNRFGHNPWVIAE